MKKKEHLTLRQRHEIPALLREGHGRKEIANIIGKDKSVITQKLQRNSWKQGYSEEHAQRLADRHSQMTWIARIPDGRDFTSLPEVAVHDNVGQRDRD